MEAKKLFNDINQTVMMLTIIHLWPSGACFIFNWYRHWSSLFFVMVMVRPVFFALDREWSSRTTSNDHLQYRHPPDYQKTQNTFSWRHSILACRWRQSIRFIRKSQVIFTFAKTTWPGIRVLSRTFKNSVDRASEQYQTRKTVWLASRF